MSRPQPHYFGAGPALLPTPVLEQVSTELLNYKGNGIGLGEISHRSKDAIAVIDAAKEKVHKLLDVPDTHTVFFAQGGGTGGFASVVYNMTAAHVAKTGRLGTANYIITGAWSQKAYEEAVKLGVPAHIVTNAKKQAGKYGSIPPQSEWSFSEDPSYVFYCDNETVHGVEFKEVPTVPKGVTLVADMSSNIFSRNIDVSKFGLIFGGAQKNIGIAGVSLYIIRKDLLERPPIEELRKLGAPITPSVFDFALICANNSAYNTVSILAVEVVNLCMASLLEKGGLKAQEAESDRKAAKVYEVLDAHPEVYETLVDPSVRSRMNIVFRVKDEDKFLKGATERQLTGLKGHRSVGGMRVSNYNAVAEESIDLLVAYLKEFAASA
ncbi:phosphoserine aminotransferase [Trichomonascus vanleenenianus]|uniref:O-phospho-L-serine:2-oxoglutarate transaminase n=1 Tax=Trichomonascus vanleenenianus TaxID=2268995 RepID=UPI003ECA7531